MIVAVVVVLVVESVVVAAAGVLVLRFVVVVLLVVVVVVVVVIMLCLLLGFVLLPFFMSRGLDLTSPSPPEPPCPVIPHPLLPPPPDPGGDELQRRYPPPHRGRGPFRAGQGVLLLLRGGGGRVDRFPVPPAAGHMDPVGRYGRGHGARSGGCDYKRCVCCGCDGGSVDLRDSDG